jgi:PPOX class probable F420-dependent enzyme
MPELNAAARAFLGEPRFAVLATVNADGSPQQTVMWYLLDDDEIVMNTERGRKKDRNLLRDSRISLCMEDGYRYITLGGSVTLEDDPVTSQADARRLALHYMGERQGTRLFEREFSKQERVTIRMKIATVDARGFEE